MGARWVTQSTCRPSAAPVRKRAGGLGELGLELGQQALLLGQDLLVPREAIELGGDLVAEREHRRLRVAVLAPETREDVQALVDRLEPPGVESHRVAERADPRERLVDLDGGRVERLPGPRSRR